jgi:hypothetical protein
MRQHLAHLCGFRGARNMSTTTTIDLDDIGMGRQYLISKGYKASWGLVRHSIGGAVSDYWYDPSGFRVEHVTDGDVVNDTFPTRLNPHNQASLEQWEPWRCRKTSCASRKFDGRGPTIALL